MHSNNSRIATDGLLVALIFLTGCHTYTVRGDRLIPYIDHARSLCASELGTPKHILVEVVARQGELSTLGRTFYTYKFADVRSANACSVDLAADGKQVDSAKLIVDEIYARHSLYASLKPEQYMHLMRLPAEEQVAATIWVKRPLDTPDFRREEQPYEAKKAFTSSFTKSFVTRLRQEFPQSAAVPIDVAFAVQARLTPSQILLVARWTEVDEVMTSDASELLAPAWHGTHRMEKAQLLSDGWRGRLGVVEFAVWSGLPVLPTVTVVTNGSSTFPRTVQHAQSVVSVLSNTAGPAVQPGASPAGQVLYAGASKLAGEAFLTQSAAVSLLLQNQTDAINMSFWTGMINSSGQLTPTVNPEAFGRYCDEQAYDLGATFVAGSGNDAMLGGVFAYVASPANGLNVIGVGMFADDHTTLWEDDSVTPDSAWKNPPGVYGDRSKPDLVASADYARLVDASSGSGASFLRGTSFAAPMVAGTIGLMNDFWRGSGYLSTLPIEVVRSVLLATAVNNVDRVMTPSKQAAVGGFPFVHLSDRDGSGGMDSGAALDVMAKYQFSLQSYPGICPAPQTRQILQFARFNLRYGQRARAAIVYSSLPTALSTPTADLDVMVMQIDPVTGASVRLAAWSGSVESNAEMVEFTAEQTGTYQVYLLTRTCTQPPRYVGYAWWIGP